MGGEKASEYCQTIHRREHSWCLLGRRFTVRKFLSWSIQIWKRTDYVESFAKGVHSCSFICHSIFHNTRVPVAFFPRFIIFRTAETASRSVKIEAIELTIRLFTQNKKEGDETSVRLCIELIFRCLIVCHITRFIEIAFEKEAGAHKKLIRRLSRWIVSILRSISRCWKVEKLDKSVTSVSNCLNGELLNQHPFRSGCVLFAGKITVGLSRDSWPHVGRRCFPRTKILAYN